MKASEARTLTFSYVNNSTIEEYYNEIMKGVELEAMKGNFEADIPSLSKLTNAEATTFINRLKADGYDIQPGRIHWKHNRD